MVAHFHQGKFVERTEPVPRRVAEDILAGSLDDLTVGGFWIAAEGSENLAGATQTVTPGQSRFESFNFLNIEV